MGVERKLVADPVELTFMRAMVATAPVRATVARIYLEGKYVISYDK